MATFVFVVHTRRPRAVELAAEAAAWLADRGHDVVLPKEDAEAIGLPDAAATRTNWPKAPPSPLRSAATAPSCGRCGCVSPGGVPVLGVNLGRLGYLTEVEAGRLTWALERFLAGDYDIEERMMLAVRVEQAGSVDRHRARAERGGGREASPGRTVNMRSSIDGRLVDDLRRRRPHRGHAHRLDRLRLLGAGPDPVAPPPGRAADAGVAAHAVRPQPGASATEETFRVEVLRRPRGDAHRRRPGPRPRCTTATPSCAGAPTARPLRHLRPARLPPASSRPSSAWRTADG